MGRTDRIRTLCNDRLAANVPPCCTRHTARTSVSETPTRPSRLRPSKDHERGRAYVRGSKYVLELLRPPLVRQQLVFEGEERMVSISFQEARERPWPPDFRRFPWRAAAGPFGFGGFPLDPRSVFSRRGATAFK